MRKIIISILTLLPFANVYAWDPGSLNGFTTKEQKTINTFVWGMNKIYKVDKARYYSILQKLDAIIEKLNKSKKSGSKTYKIISKVINLLPSENYNALAKDSIMLKNKTLFEKNYIYFYDLSASERDINFNINKNTDENWIYSDNIKYNAAENKEFEKNTFKEFINNFKSWNLESNVSILSKSYSLYNPFLPTVSVWEADFWFKVYSGWIMYISANIWWDYPCYSFEYMKKFWDRIYSFHQDSWYCWNNKDENNFDTLNLAYFKNGWTTPTKWYKESTKSTWTNGIESSENTLTKLILSFYNKSSIDSDFDNEISSFYSYIWNFDESDMNLEWFKESDYFPLNSYAKNDKWQIFYISNWWFKTELAWADVATFKIIDFPWWDYYAKDKNKVYVSWEALGWADPNTFYIWWKDLLVDKSSAYIWKIKIDWADIASIKEIWGNYLADNNAIYYYNQSKNTVFKVVWADVATFKVNDDNWDMASDKSSKYLNWVKSK